MLSDGPIIEERITKVNGDPASKHYSRGKLLGKGGFAEVYEFTCVETGQVCAGKLLPKSALGKARARQKLMSEIKIHRSLHHTNIVRFENTFEDEDFVYILSELCTNQTLNDLIRRRKRLLELEVQCYLMQILFALKYMHSFRVIHRDIKPGNIFLNDKLEIKIGDFGLATKLEFDGERKRTICGTPNYIAPEILEGRNGHSYEVDVWSIGVLIYSMFYGKAPFETHDVKLTYKRIKMLSYYFPEGISISPEAKDLISRILVLDPLERPSIDEIMNHDFFTKNPIPKLLPKCTLAVPPSSSYLRQFEKSNGLQKQLSGDLKPLRSSSQLKEVKKEPERLTPKARNERSESAGSSNSKMRIKKVAICSAYSESASGPQVWVKRWVDYSNKYGMAYVMSNGCVGISFNDSTRMISDPSGNFIQYIHRGSLQEEEIKTYECNAVPKELHKKLTIINHFRKHLGADLPKKTLNVPLPFIKKWIMTSHAIIFRLSNKVVQVYFQDRSELFLNAESRNVIFINKHKICSAFPLSSAMESKDKEMIKRLKYTKEILTTMLQGEKHSPR